MITSALLFILECWVCRSNKILNSEINQKNKLKGKFVFFTTVCLEIKVSLVFLD